MSFVSMSSTKRNQKNNGSQEKQLANIQLAAFKMKAVTFQLNRKGKLHPFTCVMREHYLYLLQKHFDEGEVYCKFSCFTYISTQKDFKEPN